MWSFFVSKAIPGFGLIVPAKFYPAKGLQDDCNDDEWRDPNINDIKMEYSKFCL